MLLLRKNFHTFFSQKKNLDEAVQTWVAGQEVVVKNVNVNIPCVFIMVSSAFLGFPLPPFLSSIHYFKFVANLNQWIELRKGGKGKPRKAEETMIKTQGMFAFTSLTTTFIYFIFTFLSTVAPSVLKDCFSGGLGNN